MRIMIECPASQAQDYGALAGLLDEDDDSLFLYEENVVECLSYWLDRALDKLDNDNLEKLRDAMLGRIDRIEATRLGMDYLTYRRFKEGREGRDFAISP